LREQALAGARQLDHRTAYAVEMLNDKYDIGAPGEVLKNLPMLELATTFRPKADDPAALQRAA
jgi:hypothetical protein